MSVLTASPKIPSSPKSASPHKVIQNDTFQEPVPMHNLPSAWRDRPPLGRLRQGSQDAVVKTVWTSSREENEDPHDLSFVSGAAPRASMMDNMVLSLDRFAFGGEEGSPEANQALGESMRKRGHTFSSSLSSATDMRAGKTHSSPSNHMTRAFRPNSVRQQPSRSLLASIFGEDEDSARAQAYDAQRATAPSAQADRVYVRRARKGTNSSSASSSIDLGHLAKMTGRLGGPRDRRSRSFDFGSRKTKDVGPEDIDGLPKTIALLRTDSPSGADEDVFQAITAGRRNSLKSLKSTYHRPKPGSGTLGNHAMKNKRPDQTPTLPSMKSSPALNSANKNIQDQSVTLKPGFFRRLFGSSNHSLASIDSNTVLHSIPQARAPDRPTTPPSKAQKTIHRVSTDSSANKENHPVVTKKSSTFFRRRKKSMSHGIPPPMPLNLGNEEKRVSQLGQESPVSSLRAFMDPYLGQGQSTPGHRRGDSGPALGREPESQRNQLHGVPVQVTEQASKVDIAAHMQPKPYSRAEATLRAPYQDSFLFDSSSMEENRSKAVSQPDLASEGVTIEALPKSQNESSNSLRPTDNRSRTPSPHRIRPEIPPRQNSGQSARSVSTSKLQDLPRSEQGNHAAKHFGGEDTNARPHLTSPRPSESDISIYRSAPSTPLQVDASGNDIKRPFAVHITHPSVTIGPGEKAKVMARKVFEHPDEDIDRLGAGAWLGESGSERETIRDAFMELFDWRSYNILYALRGLCEKIALKGESQQVDRVLEAFAKRWCECNTRHGFKSHDVVHGICYSLLLLNTDLHRADIGAKMTKAQFVRNAIPVIRQSARTANESMTPRSASVSNQSLRSDHKAPFRRQSVDRENPSRPELSRAETSDFEGLHAKFGPLIDAPYTGSDKSWEALIEEVLKAFYTSISRQPLPLGGSQPALSNLLPNNLLNTAHTLRRTPSTLSKAHSESFRSRLASETKSLGTRWPGKVRSRPRLPTPGGFGSSRTSLDDQSSNWSPSMSSTWSKASNGRTLTSASVDSFATEHTQADYQSSIGFANALSQAIIRDEQVDAPQDEGIKAAPLLDDDSLELCGAPWAKEGILKHKCHLEGADKKSKDRNWTDCFAVIEKGYMRLFSFSTTAKTLRNRARTKTPGAVVGGGNWQDNAEEIWKFVLRHTIASTLPPPGYSKARPYVWALSLPTGAVHLFSVGTPDIVKEFVTTANFWSARLSKEPLMGAVGSMEYGWSDSVIDRALTNADSQPHVYPGQSRPSTQMSIRSSLDYPGARPKLPGDKAYINEWTPPTQTMHASQLMEVDQLKALQTYVKSVEEELKKHNELRTHMLLAFSNRHPNSVKAMTNWEKKSSYLLREIVKFSTYIDVLQAAQAEKDKVYKMRREEDESRRAEDDSRALAASMGSPGK